MNIQVYAVTLLSYLIFHVIYKQTVCCFYQLQEEPYLSLMFVRICYHRGYCTSTFSFVNCNCFTVLYHNLSIIIFHCIIRSPLWRTIPAKFISHTKKALPKWIQPFQKFNLQEETPSLTLHIKSPPPPPDRISLFCAPGM